MNRTDEVILVNEQDEVLGSMEKIAAHRQALLHRAFSVFIFNKKGEMLLQKRASGKYHSPDLWTNACCSHPMPGETTEAAAHRRLQEELGFDTPLEHLFHFVYCTPFDNGLTEHELDHVFIGHYDGDIRPNPAEIGDYCFMKMESIADSMQQYPQKYTSWFNIAFPKLESYWSVRQD
jgi:isopentenyl-diphosphate delta-isomerase